MCLDPCSNTANASSPGKGEGGRRQQQPQVSFWWYFQPCSPLGGLDSSASPSPKIQSIPAYIESEGYCTDDDNDDDESSDNKNRKGVDDEYNNVSDDNGDDQQDVSAPNLPRCHQPIFVLSNISFSYRLNPTVKVLSGINLHLRPNKIVVHGWG